MRRICIVCCNCAFFVHFITFVDNTFYVCSNLKNIVFSENVEFICQEAFANCWSLGSIKVMATEPPFAYENTFLNYEIELCVPEEAIETYRTTAPWSNFSTIRNLDGEEVEVKVKLCCYPIIDYINGLVVLSCETEEVTFKSSCTAIVKIGNRSVKVLVK